MKNGRSKRIISLVMVLMMVATLVNVQALQVHADESDVIKWTKGVTEAEGYYNEGIYFDKSTGTITDCDFHVTEVIVPEEIEGVKVTAIGDKAFSHIDNLKKIEIPDTITTIGASAFSYSDIKEFYIPQNVKSIGEGAFYGTTYMKEFTVDEDNEYFLSRDGVLFNKKATKLIQFPLGLYAEVYWMPEGVTEIKTHAFAYSEIREVVCPNSLTVIREFAFQGAYELTKVFLGDGVERIEDGAFWECDMLEQINIPASVEYLSSSAFFDCKSIKNINVDSKNKNYSSKDGVLYNKDKTILYRYTSGSEADMFIVPDSVEEISYGAVSDSDNLVKLDSGINTKTIQSSAFSNCNNLEKLVIYDKVGEYGVSYNICSGSNKVSILGYNGSYIETFANNYGIPFIPLNGLDEDDLFYEYNKYLKNKGYEKSIKAFQKEMYTIVASQSKNDEFLAILKSNMSGLATTLRNWMNVHTERDKRILNEQIAVEYIMSVSKQSNPFMDFLESDEYEAIGISGDVVDIIENGWKSYDEKKLLAKELAKASDSLSEEDLMKVIKEVEDNWKTVDKLFKGANFVVENAEVVTFIFTMILLQEETITQLQENIDKKSALYFGLGEILKHQDDAALAYFQLFLDGEIIEMVTDKAAEVGITKLSEVCLAWLTGYAEPHVFSGATLFIAGLTYKMIQWTVLKDVPDLEAVEKSFIAISNQKTLESAIWNKQNDIIENYQNGNYDNVKKLKSEYKLLYNTYIASLEKGYEHVLAIADNKERKKLQKKYAACKNALSYKKYIKSCLKNAQICTSEAIDYYVDNNKAYITNIDIPGDGYVFLSLRSAAEEDAELYSIDIPEEINGYEVAGIDSASFSERDDVEIISLPDSVEKIGSNAFAGCDNLHSIYMEEGVSSIDEGAFRDCTNLNEIEIPDSVTEIHSDAFSGISEINIIASEETEAAVFAQSSTNATHEIKPLECTGIEIVNLPAKTSFGMSEQIDTTGLQIKATYNNGSTAVLDSGFYCEFVDKKLGTTTVAVYYDSYETSYDVEITADECEYLIVYEDENGREIKEPSSGKAMAGTDITVEAPEIEGYIADVENSNFTIGAENTFVITYTAIPKINIANADIMYDDPAIFTGQQIKPNVEIRYDGELLKEGTDYYIEYGENIEVGGQFTVYGENRFEGAVTFDFEIISESDEPVEPDTPENPDNPDQEQTEIKKSMVSLESDTFIYNGSEQTPEVVVEGLTEGVDYEVSYTNNINAGTATVIVTGIGKYMGEVELSFEIKPKDITDEWFGLSQWDYTYDGSQKTPEVIFEGLEESVDFEVTYEGGIEIGYGSGKVIVTGIGNYTGQSTNYYDIYPVAPKAPSKVTATLYGYDDMKISWNKVAGASGYYVYGKRASESSYTYYGSTKNLYYKKANLKDGSKYTFRVEPYVEYNDERFEYDVYKTSLGVYTLKKLNVPKVKKASSKYVKVTWNNIYGESGYQIARSKYKTKKFTIVKKSIGSAYKSSKIKTTRNKTYYYKVRAYKKVNGKKIYGPWSSVKKYKLK